MAAQRAGRCLGSTVGLWAPGAALGSPASVEPEGGTERDNVPSPTKWSLRAKHNASPTHPASSDGGHTADTQLTVRTQQQPALDANQGPVGPYKEVRAGTRSHNYS